MSVPNVESGILTGLSNADSLESMTLAKELGVPHQSVVGTMKSLEGEDYVKSTMKEHTDWKLSAEAQSICEQGSPEYRIWQEVRESPQSQDDVTAKLGKETVSLGIKNGMKDQNIKVAKEDGKLIISNAAKGDVSDTVRTQLEELRSSAAVDSKVIDALKKRKLVSQETTKVFTLNKGPNYAPVRQRLATDITRQMLLDGSWATTPFKKLNFAAQGREPAGGQLHPLLKVRQEFREIFLELGFNEMDTQQWVESSFWNFDTLFVPQQHPARDSQDTFFVSKPAKANPATPDYISRVKAVHENGYLNSWSEEETCRNVLRTHTTAVSSWVLYGIAQSAPVDEATGKRNFRPARYFSIDRVFRNEEMDKTHLCEFHQVEGFVVDRNLSLANMMHTLHQFFVRIGITDLRFKPAYNPYTEPSMEIFGYHAGLDKWMEVGNSGVFRPEMMKPYGFDDDVTAIAWGLSLERPTMIKYGIKSIHELFGHKVDLRFIRKARIARY